MVQNADVLEITYQSGFGDSEPIAANVFGYEISGLTETDPDIVYNAIFAALDNALIEPIVNIMSAAVGFYSMQVKNLTNGLDIRDYVYPSFRRGEVQGECLPQFVAWGFQLNRATLATRNGSKRIIGVNELWQVNGTVIAGQEQLQAAGSAMGSVVQVDDGLGLEFQLIPRILRRSATGALLAVNGVQSGSFKRITSQTSRKD